MTEQKTYGFVQRTHHLILDSAAYPESQIPAEQELTEEDLSMEPETETPHHLHPAPALKNAAHHPSEDRHRRKCQICRHADLDQIEEDFLQWRRPWAISNEYGVPEASLFRHAHAVGLFSLRRDNLRLALDRVIERGSRIENTGDTIIRAVRAQACLTDENRWIEPVKHVHITTETVVPSPQLP